MWDLTKPVDDLDLINRVNGRRQAAMNAKDLITYDHAQCQVVEHISKVVPDVGAAVFASAFSIEAI